MPHAVCQTNHPTRARSTSRRRLAAIAAGAALLVAPLVAIGAPAAEAASSTTYYVNCSSKHTGSGTSKSPWRTLSSVEAHGTFAPGDRILLKRGTSCRGQFKPSGSGTAGHPIVVGAWGKGARPKIVGAGTKNQTGAVQLRNVSHWTVQDLDITNWTGGKNPNTYRSGILVWNSGVGRLAGITLQRNVIHSVSSNAAGPGRPRDFGGISVITAGAHGDGYDKVRISHNTVKSVGRTGIMVSNREYPGGADTGVLIDSNHVTDSRGDGIVLLGSTGGRLAYNVVKGSANFWPCPQCKGISPATANAAIWTAQSKGVRIDHNEASKTRYLGGDGEGFDIDASAVDTVMEYNYSHDNEGGGVIFCASKNATVRFNIFENNEKSAIAFIGSMPATNTSIYNNTIYASKTTNAKTVRYFNGAHGKGIKFFNNIVYNFGRGSYMWPTKVWSRSNTYVGTHSAGEPRGTGYSLAAPGLKNPGTGRDGRSTLGGYRPMKPSNFRKGIAISSKVKTDFFGKRINPKHPPRGAAG